MRVCVLGSGILGITTAYFLNERGFDVTVLERKSGPAEETSFANGGQLSYSHAEPWAVPSVLPKIIKWMFKENSPLVLNLRFDPAMWAWGLRFLAQCTNAKAKENALNTLRLALYSRDVLANIRAKVPFDFHFLQKGVLHVFTDEKLLASAEKQAAFQADYGCEYQALDAAATVALEPALNHLAPKIKGSVYHAQDESGDIYRFSVELAKYCESKGVKFRYNADIKSMIKEGDRIKGLRTSHGVVEADAYVMACGSYSTPLLNSVGVRLPIYPMKGYSLSVPISDESRVPSISITDQGSKIVYSRLGNILRSAGTAEFAGYDHTITQKRIQHLKNEMKRIFGDVSDYNKATGWACLRPQTPQGTPYIGKTHLSNLYLNTGHGTLGWTLGPGSSKIVSDIIAGEQPEIDLSGLTA